MNTGNMMIRLMLNCCIWVGSRIICSLTERRASLPVIDSCLWHTNEMSSCLERRMPQSVYRCGLTCLLHLRGTVACREGRQYVWMSMCPQFDCQCCNANWTLVLGSLCLFPIIGPTLAKLSHTWFSSNKERSPSSCLVIIIKCVCVHICSLHVSSRNH